MSIGKAKERYDELFDDAAKIAAFDKIAEKYYFVNFGATSKTDLDTLMFSLYIEQILDKDQTDISQYSDYTLSKLLGIPQSKVSNLKVKKELLYPYPDFNWREAFSRFADRAIYEQGRIKLCIPDKNVYLEVKNAIETMGGFVEVQLTSNLLQLRPEYFIDLMVEISDVADRKQLRKELKEGFRRANADINFVEKDFAKSLKEQSPEIILPLINIAASILPAPVGGVAKKVFETMKAVLAK